MASYFQDRHRFRHSGARYFPPGDGTATAANLALVAAAINTTGKFAGKAVWVSDAARMVFAAGAAADDVWKDGVNSTVYTPI